MPTALALPDTVRVEVKPGLRDQALAAYNARPDVLYAEPDYEVKAHFTPNDPGYPNQWALPTIGAPIAWDVTRGSSSVRVAVVDCGVFSQATGRAAPDGQAGHPDLRGRVTVNQDFTGSTTGFDDVCNHGTHVAGIVGAAGNNGIGVSGLAPLVTVMNAKVLADNGNGLTSNILNGVIWAVQNGAKVVNLSLGRDGLCSQSEQDTMNWAWSQGAVIVASSGNSGLPASGAPGQLRQRDLGRLDDQRRPRVHLLEHHAQRRRRGAGLQHPLDGPDRPVRLLQRHLDGGAARRRAGRAALVEEPGRDEPADRRSDQDHLQPGRRDRRALGLGTDQRRGRPDRLGLGVDRADHDAHADGDRNRDSDADADRDRRPDADANPHINPHEDADPDTRPPPRRRPSRPPRR